LLSFLIMPVLGYPLTALLILVISHGRTQPYFRTGPDRQTDPSLESFAMLVVYLFPLIYSFSPMLVLRRLLRRFRAVTAGQRRMAVPKVPVKPTWPLVSSMLWLVVPAAALGLVVRPAFATLVCVVAGIVAAVPSIVLLTFERWLGVQVDVALTARNRGRRRHLYMAFPTRGAEWSMEAALKQEGAVSPIATRLFAAGRYEDAMTLMNARFAGRPTAYLAWNIACCLSRLRRYDEAMSWLRKADGLMSITSKDFGDPDLRPLRRAGLLDEFDGR
jgi:hypothetical protein